MSLEGKAIVITGGVRRVGQALVLATWNLHKLVNLTTPFLLSQAFAHAFGHQADGQIINHLDWRGLRPGADHLPYSVSKAGLAAFTRSLAVCPGAAYQRQRIGSRRGAGTAGRDSG